MLMDGKVVDRVQPFPMRYGSGTIRDGKLVFNDIRQRTTIKHSTIPSGKRCGGVREGSSANPNTPCAQGEPPF